MNGFNFDSPCFGALLAVFLMPLLALAANEDAREVSRNLSLVQAEQLMRENAPSIRAAAIALQSSRADVITAAEAPNPQLSWNSSAINAHDSGGGPLWERSVDSVARIDQLLERGGKRSLRLRAAHAGEAAARADYSDAMRTSRMNVARAYYDLKYLQEAERIAHALVDLQSHSLSAAETRLQKGDVAKVDVMRLEIELARAQSELTDAQAAKRAGQIALTGLIGLDDAGAQLQAGDPWPSKVPLAPLPATLDARPDIVAATARSDLATAHVSLAQAARTRDVTVGVQFEHYPQPLSHANSVGIGFSIPLFIGNKYEGEIARASADRRAAEDALRTTKLAANSEIQQAQAEFIAASDKLDRYRNSVIERAQASADAAEYAYARSAIGLTDLLDARRALEAIKLDAVAAEAAYAKALVTWRAAIDPSFFELAMH